VPARRNPFLDFFCNCGVALILFRDEVQICSIRDAPCWLDEHPARVHAYLDLSDAPDCPVVVPEYCALEETGVLSAHEGLEREAKGPA